MAKIEGILKISDDEVNGELDAVVSSNESNNISLYPYTTNILDFINSMSDENENYTGASVTTIGKTNNISSLRFGAKLPNNIREAKYKGLLLGNVDSNKNLIITLSLTGTNIIGIIIKFDAYSGQYPTAYSYTDVEGNTVSVNNNTSNEIEITKMRAGYGTVTITFTKWSIANYPVGITFISFPTETIKLTKAQIISFESQSQIVSSTSGLNYGALASTGKIELSDKDNTLYNKAKLGYLNAYLFTLELKANDKVIQKHISTESPLYTADRSITLNLTDELSVWDKINVPAKEFYSGDSLYNVLEYLNNYYSFDIITLCSDIIIVGNEMIESVETYSIENYLKSLEFNANTTLKAGTLREQMEKICNCAQLVLYINRDDEIKFASARPVFISYDTDKVINIPYGKQYSKPSYDILVSNRYEEVEFN